MQGKLSRLTHRANKEADTSHCDQIPIRTWQGLRSQHGILGKDRIVVHRTGASQEQANAQNETKITNPIHQEGFHIGKHSTLALVVKTNQ